MKAVIIKSSAHGSTAPKSITLKPITLKPIVSLAALVVFSAVVFSATAFAQRQIEPATKQRAAQEAKREGAKRVYAPRIVGRSNSFIVEGTVAAITNRVICIKTAEAGRRSFDIDGQTTIFESGELISTATIADITLQPLDLQRADRVEIVAERAGGRNLARIITRISSQKGLYAKR